MLDHEGVNGRYKKFSGFIFALLNILGASVIIAVLGSYYQKRTKHIQQMLETLQDHYSLLNHWVELKSEGKSVAQYFEDRGYHHIAIYGMAELANRLMEDLEGSQILVDYGIDRDAACSIARIEDIYSPEDELPKTDVIVVTPYSALGEIKKNLEMKTSCPIISLEEIVWSV